MSAIDDRLAELSIELPEPPAPLGNYVGAHTVGNLVYLSGHGTNKPDGSFIVGKVPTVCSEEEAYQAARLVGLNLLATLKNHIGDLDRCFVKLQRIRDDHTVIVSGCINRDQPIAHIFKYLLHVPFQGIAITAAGRPNTDKTVPGIGRGMRHF